MPENSNDTVPKQPPNAAPAQPPPGLNSTVPQPTDNASPAPTPPDPNGGTTGEPQPEIPADTIQPFDTQSTAQLESLITSRIEAAVARLPVLQDARNNPINQNQSNKKTSPTNQSLPTKKSLKPTRIQETAQTAINPPILLRLRIKAKKQDLDTPKVPVTKTQTTRKISQIPKLKPKTTTTTTPPRRSPPRPSQLPGTRASEESESIRGSSSRPLRQRLPDQL